MTGRLVTISFTSLDSPGGVPRWCRDFASCFPETKHYCWQDCPLSKFNEPMAEWDRAAVLNAWLRKFGKVDKDDIFIVDGFWGQGLEDFPNVISVCHGIWSHLIKEEADAGKKPDFPLNHAMQVGYRKGHLKRGGKLVAVSQFIQHQMQIQWGFESEVINNAIDLEKYTPSDEPHYLGKPFIIHGINDRGNKNKGWEHIEYLKENLDAVILSLDEASGHLDQEDKHKVLAMADLVVIPSAYEGNSYFALETLACDVPVVTYNVGLFYELSKRDHDHPFWPARYDVGYIMPRICRSKEMTLEYVKLALEGLKDFPHSNSPRYVAKTYQVYNFHAHWRAYLNREFGYESSSQS